MGAPATQSADTFAAWIDDNPLRRWRTENGESILNTASRLGCAMTSIRLWERGVHVPQGDAMVKIKRLLGSDLSDDEFLDAWLAWCKAKPELPS